VTNLEVEMTLDRVNDGRRHERRTGTVQVDAVREARCGSPEFGDVQHSVMLGWWVTTGCTSSAASYARQGNDVSGRRP